MNQARIIEELRSIEQELFGQAQWFEQMHKRCYSLRERLEGVHPPASARGLSRTEKAAAEGSARFRKKMAAKPTK